MTRFFARRTLVLVLALACTTFATAQTERILYEFGSTAGDGENPMSGLISDPAGHLYGTASYGGDNVNNWGTVFELTPQASGWTEQLLHTFAGYYTDGSEPWGSLVRDAAGNLYGTTLNGGNSNFGSIFELTPKAGGGWSERVLLSFNGYPEGGANPKSGLILDAAGNLYGTTTGGGTYPQGTVFKLALQAGGLWKETILHSFTGTPSDGTDPEANLIFDGAGNLYGTTASGGVYNYGTVFELSPNASGTWTEKILHSFGGGSDGKNPSGSLIFDAAGNLYGTTSYGGANTFCGNVFELKRNAHGAWTETILHTFEGYPTDGYASYASLTFDAAGNLYGTTYEGGSANSGTAFELVPGADGVWSEVVLHNFGLGTDGIGPVGGLTFGAGGRLYGTTSAGGASNGGTVFEITP